NTPDQITFHRYQHSAVLQSLLWLEVYEREEIWKPDKMDFVTGIPTPEETEGLYYPPVGFWQKVAATLF
ncbi:uncharacterized protein EDB91DRAFT_51653, partial [Suillus paluster]|uniref:uncharacterized protein n=1 Tax=Suillus paluster TaxID=48578 RepID=UPI001B85EFDC